MYDLRLLIALTAALAGLSALLLALAALDLASALGLHLWLLASPRAARQARFRSALAANRGRSRRRVRRKP